MKALVGAAFLLTTGIGDLLIVIINLIHFTDNYAVLFLSYTILMTVVITIFALMCIFYYTYADFTEVPDDEKEELESTDGKFMFLFREWTKISLLDSNNDSSSTKSTRRIVDSSKYDPFEEAWQTKL